MSKKLNIFLVVGLLLSLTILLPSPAVAGEDPPADPNRVLPPPITGINTNIIDSGAETEELAPSGTVGEAGVTVPLPAGSPNYVELEPQSASVGPQISGGLGVPLRYQDPADVTCGAAALGMALDFAALSGEGNAPSNDLLVSGLRSSGLLYDDVGTGVEELAYLARGYGYRGSYAFHDWTLAQLQEQLAAGRPPVVALGANGDGQPGHFVTVTGISADGQFVRYNDPILGERTVSVQEFNRLWGAQGFSGMVAQAQPLSAASDPMLPWMGLFGALSMLTVMVRRKSTRQDIKDTYARVRALLSHPGRKGLGGRLASGSGGGGGSTPARLPVYDWQKVQVGMKRVPKQVPVYETRKVKVGTRTVTTTVPKYTLKRVQVGMRTERYRVKVTRYRTESYTDWVKDTYRVPKYRTRRYVRYYRRRRVRKTRWVRRGWRWYRKTYYTYKRKPVYGRRRVRVGWKTKTRMKRG